MKETFDKFFGRIFCSFVNGRVFVWKTKKLMDMPASSKNMPEIWDIATAKRYARILQQNELKVFV